MSLTIGIIGLPQAGKTTLFSALTRLDAGAASASQKPNQARVAVPDERLDKASAIFTPKKTTPTAVDFLDVAATVTVEEKGSLGKRVLGSFRTVDALLMVARAFDHPYLGAPRPRADLETLDLELVISDLSVIENTLERNRKMPTEARVWFEQVRDVLQEGRRPDPALIASPPEAARPFAQSMSLLVAKPTIVAANVGESALGNEDADPAAQEARGWAEEHRREFFAVCAAIEQEISQLPPEEAQEFMSGLGIEKSGLDKLIVASYRSLDLITFLTVGEDECRCWTVHRGATAPEAAGKIHSDLEKGFIRAEVVTSEDFLRLGTMAACRDKGVLRLEGRTYVVQDGDILNIRFNV
ncbi:MAG: redox-regulated ATPase YchF [Armatimonadetes bacterium]|nr:redox-regulated ATPase YchF [Armatimonadota bacterium]